MRALALGLIAYLLAYGAARWGHCLVMWDGYRGRYGVAAADLSGPVPWQGVVVVTACSVVFAPAAALESAVRGARELP
jgi:hypothetical protein